MKNIYVLILISLATLLGCSQSQPKTLENLKAGIRGETTAGAKYAAFAKKAREEGFLRIAKLFDAASKSELIHAMNHRMVLEAMNEQIDEFKLKFKIRSTAKNLENAINGETFEVTTMYPQFLSSAKYEKQSSAELTFNRALETEKKHQMLYINALKAYKAKNQNSISSEYAICPVCGNTFEKDKIDERCAICGTGKDQFIMN